MTKSRKYKGSTCPQKPKRLTINFEESDIIEVKRLAQANREFPGQWIRRMIGTLVREGVVKLDDELCKK